MSRRRDRGARLLAVAAWAAAAAPWPAARAQQATPTQELGTVTVQGVAYGADAVELPSTITVLDRKALVEGQPQVNLSESLGQVPGLVVNNRQDYAQDMQMSIRGFGADSAFGVQDIYITLDGMPLTMPDGQGQAQTIDLPTLGGMRVIKGPFAALYGNAAGGVIEAFTRDAPQPPSAQLRSWIGPWGSSQTTLSGGGSSGAWSGIAGLTNFHTDGWRQHGAATRQHFNGVLNFDPHADDHVALVFNALDQDAQDPGGLTAAELRQNPQQVDPAILRYDTRKTTHNRQLGLSWEHRFGADDTLSASVDAGTRAITQFLPMAGNFGFSAGGVVGLDDHFGHSRLEYAHSGRLAARPYTLAAGVDYGRLNEYRKGWVNNLGIQGALRNDQYNTVDNLAQYVQAHWDLTPRLSVSGGVRHDQVRFDSTNAADALFNPGSSGGARYGSTDPVVGVLYAADAHNRFYADYGHGFVTPTAYQLAYRPDGKPGLNFALQPMHMRNAEIGWRGNYGALKVDAALYDVDTDNQIVVYASTAGRTSYVNAGSTRRRGIDLGVDLALPWNLAARAAWSLADVRFVGGPYDGRTMPGAPRQQLDASLTWRPRLTARALRGFYTRVSMLARSQVWVDAPNSAAAPGWASFDAGAGIEQRHGAWRLAEFVRVENLFDRNYVAAVVIADSNGRYYEAAPGRNAIVGIELSRDF